MKAGINLLDTYTIRAQVIPAILAAIPAIALIAAFVSWKDLGLTHALAGVGLLAVFWIFADRARRLGKELEPALFKRMGGMPSIVMLRHSDGAFKAAKDAYHSFLSRKVGAPAPTAEQEAANPEAADQYYDRACAWLRDRTRDTRKFNVLFNENMTYGARRNLLGVKPFALTLNFVVAVISAGLLVLFRPLADIGTTSASLTAVLAVAVIHAACFLRFVNEDAVVQAARTYGRQLVLCCDSLNDDPKSAPTRPTKPKTA